MDNSVNINRAFESITDNIKTSAKQSFYYGLKKGATRIRSKEEGKILMVAKSQPNEWRTLKNLRLQVPEI